MENDISILIADVKKHKSIVRNDKLKFLDGRISIENRI
jgi:hypothetical protein